MTEEEVTDRKELMSENNRKIHTKTDGVKAERNYAPLLYAGAIVLAVTSVILIAVFLIRFFGVVHLTSDTEGSTLTDSKNGVVYSLAPISYTADLDTDSVSDKSGLLAVSHEISGESGLFGHPGSQIVKLGGGDVGMGRADDLLLDLQ